MASNIIVHNPFFFIFSYFSFLVFTQAQQKDSIVCGKSGRPDVIVCFVKTLSEKSSMIKSESAISPGCFGLGRNRLPVIYIDQTSFYEMA